MRTKVTISQASDVSEIYLDINKGVLPEGLENMLAWVNVENVRIQYKDRIEVYSKIEYECGGCGEYGHHTLVCPLREII